MYNSCFPLIRVRVSTRDPPYMSPLVKLLCKKRNRLKSNNSDLQEKINKLIRENQIKSVSNEKQKYTRGSKGWWKTTNNITGRKSHDVQVSNVIDPEEINNFFQAINTDNEYVAPESVVIEQGTRIPTVDVHEVWDLLVHQKRTASGPDNLPYWIWRDFAHHLAPVITTIFNNSILNQEVPNLWKIANVIPIPKASPLESCDQLRPISLTNIIMRIFERLVYRNELAQPLKEFIGSDQFAYKANHNTTMALIKNQHFWLKSLDSGADFVRVFAFDFRKAFDSVSHVIVCNKLKSLNVNPYVVNWIISFLNDRLQRVAVDGIKTDLVSINKGVPQGTVLGPVLFTIMVNDISPVNVPRSLMTKFADDITLSVPISSESDDPSDQEVQNIKDWANDNRMVLHMKKTWEMIERGKTKKPLPREVDGVERKPELKILGITFNEDPCNWDTHFDNMLSKASARMYILRVCKYYGYSSCEIHQLFNSLIMPIFLYGIEVWGCAYQTKYIERLNKFFKRALKFGYTEDCIVFQDVIRSRDTKLWNNIVSNSDHCLSDILPPIRKRTGRKRGHNYILPKVRTERFKRVFINRCLFQLL